MAKSRLLIENYAGVVVVTFQDSAILEMPVRDQLCTDLYALVEKQDKRKVVLDFTNVRFLASHTLGILLTFQKKATAAKGEVVLCSVRAELMKVFSLTNLDRLFRFFPDDAAALAHFKVRVQ